MYRDYTANLLKGITYVVNMPSARPVELFESLGNAAALSSFHPDI